MTQEMLAWTLKGFYHLLTRQFLRYYEKVEKKMRLSKIRSFRLK